MLSPVLVEVKVSSRQAKLFILLNSSGIYTVIIILHRSSSRFMMKCSSGKLKKRMCILDFRCQNLNCKSMIHNMHPCVCFLSTEVISHHHYQNQITFSGFMDFYLHLLLKKIMQQFSFSSFPYLFSNSSIPKLEDISNFLAKSYI